jgi:rhodanese-related sulfurtransferase
VRSERFLGQAVALLATSAVVAAISNGVAGPERKLLWVGSYAAASAKTAPVPPPSVAPAASVTPASDQAFPPHPDKAWIEVSGEDVAALFARKNVLFLDARRSSVYRDGHIAGARSFSVWEVDVDDKVKALFAEGLDQSAPVVAYCSGGECEDSHMLAERLYRVGFDNVLVYKDGFPDWQKRGLAVTRGTQP